MLNRNDDIKPFILKQLRIFLDNLLELLVLFVSSTHRTSRAKAIFPAKIGRMQFNLINRDILTKLKPAPAVLKIFPEILGSKRLLKFIDGKWKSPPLLDVDPMAIYTSPERLLSLIAILETL
jgi:hypothetical protein